jgi:hypothetical protein
LDEVLDIVGLQTDSRWTRLYPLYSTKKSLGAFNQVLQGNLPPAGNGWLALQQLAAWQQIGLSGFANTLRAENKLVSAQLVDKDVAYTALALSRFSKAQIVPEDGTTGVVNLRLQEVPFEKAVGKVAKQVRHNWARVYTLQPLNGAALVKKSAPPPTTVNEGGEVDTNQVTITQDQGPLPPDRALEAIVSTMTPEERQQTLEQMANGGAGGGRGFSPGGGQQPMQGGSYGGGAPGAAGTAGAGGATAQPPQEDMETRIENRLKNGTVDQRLAHDRSVLNSKKAGK